MNEDLLRWQRALGHRDTGAVAGALKPATFDRYFRRIVDSLDEGVLIFSVGRRMLFWNTTAEHMLGRTFSAREAPDEWIILRPDGERLPLAESPVNRALLQGISVSRQLLGDIAPDGTLRWLEVSAAPLGLVQGLPAVLVTFIDVTERRRAEQEVRRYREKMEALVEIRVHEAEEARRRLGEFIRNAPIPMCVFDNDGALAIANERFWATFGYVPAQVPGLAEWWQLAYPDPDYRREAVRIWIGLQGKTNGGMHRATAEQRVTRSDGRVLTMEISAVSLEYGYLATFVDVSSRHETAARVQEIADINQRLIESSTQGMALFRHDGTCLLVNEVAAYLLNVPRTTLLQGNLYHLPAWHATGFRPAVEQALRQMQPQRVECELRLANGESHWVEIDLVPFSLHEERRLLLMFDDITAYRTEEFRLREDKRIAEEANKVKGAFLASMSHEIRNPLNAIMGMAEVLKDERLDPDQRRLVETIAAAGHSLLDLVNDVLDFAKIEAGRLEVESQAFAVGQLLAHLVQLWSPSAEQKGLRLSVDGLPELPAVLIGDSQRVTQILTNFVSNAIKFTAVGEVRLRVVRLPVAQGRELRLRFEVADTGTGIPPEDLQRVFDAFTQLDEPSLARNSGTGLGLAISRELAALLGGRVGADSTPGLGSTFWLELPFQTSEARTHLPADVDQPADPVGALIGQRVLIVDDTPVNLEVAARLLTRAGALVQTAAGGQQALHLLQHGLVWPTVLLLDVQMPDMDGLTLARHIRLLPRADDLTILALSAGTLPAQREAARAAGMDDFIAKPFDLHEMVGVVLRALRQRSIRPADFAGTGSQPDSHEDLNWISTLARARAQGFPDVSGHDMAVAFRRMAGDSTLYLRSLRLFDAELERAVQMLGQTTGAGVDAEPLRRAVHRLKGAAGMVACTEVHRLASLLEPLFEQLPGPAALLEAGLPQRLRESLLQLRGSCDRQRDALHVALAELSATGEPGGQPAETAAAAWPGAPVAIDRKPGTPTAIAGPGVLLAEDWEAVPALPSDARALLFTLAASLEARDLSALEEFSNLPASLLQRLPERLLTVLRHHLDHLDFTAAAALLRRLL